MDSPSPTTNPNATAFEASVVEAVNKRLAIVDKCSALPKPRQKMLELEWDDVDNSEIRLLGQGSFSRVHLVGLNDVPGKSFALKQLNLCSATAFSKQYRRGAIDIALEGSLISCLEHENIIKIRAVKKGCIGTSTNDKVLDYLTETLDGRIERWRNEENTMARLKAKMCGHDEKLMNRLGTAAIGIAKGMEYLHSLGGKEFKCMKKLHELGFLSHTFTSFSKFFSVT